MYDAIYRDIRSADSKMKQTDGQYVNISSIRFVIPVVFIINYRLQCVYLSNTTIWW